MRSPLTALFVATLAVSVAACGAADARRQHAADAIAGTAALAQEDARGVREATAPGVVAHIEGAVGVRRDALPPARRSPSEIRQAPQTYTTAAEQERDRTMDALSLFGWVAAAAAVALGAVKATGLGGPAIQILASILQSKAQKIAGEKTKVVADAGITLIEVIEQMPNDGTIGDLKKRIAKVAGPESIAIIHEVKSNVRNQAH